VQLVRAVAAARAGDIDAAARALGAARGDPGPGGIRAQLEVMRRHAEAWILAAGGRIDEALAALAGGSPTGPDAERVLDALVVTAETRGELLLAANRPGEALIALAEASATAPHRFRTIWLLARASVSAGRLDDAARYYRELLTQATDASPGRAALDEARAWLGQPRP
jgi:predicted Zn-dependent protease